MLQERHSEQESPLTEYGCAWFDEHNYPEFNPADAKVKYNPHPKK
jgi:hypothetical protein